MENNKDSKEYWYNIAQDAIKRIVEMQNRIKELESTIGYYKELVNYYFNATKQKV